jgi:hypothetical protein
MIKCSFDVIDLSILSYMMCNMMWLHMGLKQIEYLYLQTTNE